MSLFYKSFRIGSSFIFDIINAVYKTAIPNYGCEQLLSEQLKMGQVKLDKLNTTFFYPGKLIRFTKC